VVLAACGGRTPAEGKDAVGPSTVRLVPLKEAIVLETAGPPPSDTSVTFPTGQRRVIVLRHGPPDNVTFAVLAFAPASFGPDSGREVRVDVRPRPGLYGVDVTSSLPIRAGATISFSYARYFLAPARARATYGNDPAYERALAIGQLQPNGLLALMPPIRPTADVLSSSLPSAGSYLVAASR
jgi:hypothetical protein